MKRQSITALLTIAILGIAHYSRATIENPNLKEYYHLGDYFMKTDQYDRAIENNRAMVTAHPGTKEAERGWLGIGWGYDKLMRKAMSDLGKAKGRAGVTKRELRQLEVSIRENMNNAYAAYQHVITHFPAKKADAIIGLAQLYGAFGEEKTGDAVREYRRVVDYHPEEAGRAQLLLGDFHLAIGEMDKAEGIYTAAITAFPEIASLAQMKLADLLSRANLNAKAADSYDAIISSLGIDGAYSSNYHPMGNIMAEAIEKRGRAVRELKNPEDELEGYEAAISRYYGTNTSMAANLQLAQAYWYYGKTDQAKSLLDSIAKSYPKSIWAVRSLMKLAELQGVSPAAADTLRRIIASYPQSSLRVDAQMKLAELSLQLAERQDDEEKKTALKNNAANACKSITATYPGSPEAIKAGEFIKKNNL